MATPSITTKLPSSSAALVFGSFLHGSEPRDIDVLVLYDPSVFSPADAYRAHASFVKEVQRLVGLPVDLTLLTYGEEESSGFIEDTGAVPIEEAIEKLTSHSTGPARKAAQAGEFKR
ncbi:nucleotidyltransferase domain-containing protein [Methylobacter sp.]|uniref:nucleotidyltransferase domain-containing protein n=1 Tax=Methylobacter sp. TaxID=2051955 RepID=UPI003DA4A337